MEAESTTLSLTDDAGFDDYIFRLYHANSKLRKGMYGDDFVVTQALEHNPDVLRKIATPSRSYAPDIPRIRMPRPAPEPGFMELLRKRRSCRSFNGEQLTMDQLSRILFAAYGFTGAARSEKGGYEVGLRTVPSAGALYPLEVYLVAFSDGEIERGQYYFDAARHQLARIGDRRVQPEFFLAGNQTWMERVPLVIVISAVFRRSSFKYKERAYRLVLLEAGHMAQNICLSTAEMGLGCIACGGFFEECLDEILELNGTDETAIYIMGVGAP